MTAPGEGSLPTQGSFDAGCSLDADAAAERMRAWETLSSDAQIRRHDGPDRVVIVYRDDAETRARLDRLARLERTCCAGFLQFQVDEVPEGVELAITRAPGVPGRVDALLSSVTPRKGDR